MSDRDGGGGLLTSSGNDGRVGCLDVPLLLVLIVFVRLGGCDEYGGSEPLFSFPKEYIESLSSSEPESTGSVGTR